MEIFHKGGHVSNTIFILGAGASKMADVPLMYDFLDAAYYLWKQGFINENETEFKLVFGAISELQKVHSKSKLDIINIESVFSAFEMAKTLRQFSDYSHEQIQQLSRAMRLLIIKTIESKVSFKRNQSDILPPPPYKEFAEMLYKLKYRATPKQTISIITFNYDMCSDYALSFKNLKFDYGLREEIDKEHLPLLKLHGSLNWGYCKECNRIIPYNVDEYCNKNGWHQNQGTFNMAIGSQLATLVHCEKNLDPDPVIVPPTWNKTDYHRTLSSVWSHAAKELSEAEHIFIIGYSLPPSDEFFRYLYALGTVGNTPFKTFWVVNPDKSGLTEARYKELLGPGAGQRFIYKEKVFADVIDEINGYFGVR